MPEQYEDDLDAVLGSVARLNTSLTNVPKDRAGPIAARLRGANAKIWKMINELEAHHLMHLYDIHGLIRQMAQPDNETIADVWVRLVETGAIKFNDKKILDLARKYGLKIEDYREEE